MSNDSIQAILDFWFGDRSASDGAIAERQAPLWWQARTDDDQAIGNNFGDLARHAVEGQLDDWVQTAEGRLALILLLDQFPRAIYRGEPEAFAQDHSALAHSIQAQGQGQDRELRPVERVFMYAPMLHAESLMVQDECVLCFERLLDKVSEADRPAFERLLETARHRREIVLRFDRFPHRNEVLARPSTPAETAYLNGEESETA
jgi:uncharacterized protein (DUF924 family)